MSFFAGVRLSSVFVFVLLASTSVTLIKVALQKGTEDVAVSRDAIESGDSAECHGYAIWKQCLPRFLIIGAGKCGTSSLLYYLADHPDVRLPSKKQVAFFDHQYRRGMSWYLQHFPKDLETNQVTGESTPGYMVYSRVAGRIAQEMPHVRLVAVLRDPVERAWSAYHYHYLSQARAAQLGEALISFDEFVAMEMAHLRHCVDLDQTYQEHGRGTDLHEECYRGPLEEQLGQVVQGRLASGDGCGPQCQVALSPPRSNMLCARSLMGRGLYATSCEDTTRSFQPPTLKSCAQRPCAPGPAGWPLLPAPWLR